MWPDPRGSSLGRHGAWLSLPHLRRLAPRCPVPFWAVGPSPLLRPLGILRETNTRTRATTGLTHRISWSGTRRPPNPMGMTPVSNKWPLWGSREVWTLQNRILELEGLLERTPLHRHEGAERRGLSGGLGVGQSCPQNVGMDAGPGGTQAFGLGCSGVSLGDRQHLGNT